MARLLPKHLADLQRSGLSDASIAQAGLYSETDPRRIAKVLNWDSPAKKLGPCLVFPFRDRNGQLDGFARLRPDRPRKSGGKYEQPAGCGNRAYFTVAACLAIREPRSTIILVEGEKKALAVEQAGFPCIGLTGVWNWQRPREKGDGGLPTGQRELIADLAGIDRASRIVPIIFDTDPYRNPAVNHAGAELARVLARLGAFPIVIPLPIGPRGPDGLPGKMGVDDFIVAHGQDAFRSLVEKYLSPAAVRSLEDYRQDLERARLESVGVPGIYLDTSPPGAGKSHADMRAAARAESTLTVVPSHDIGEEVVQLYEARGLWAVKYPALNEETCQDYKEASAAIEAGLSASSAVCPTCLWSDDCPYRAGVEEARAAPHAVATHARTQRMFENLAEGRPYISIHEDAAGLLKPYVEVSSPGDFRAVAEVARYAGGKAARQGGDTDRLVFWNAETIALQLATSLEEADRTAVVPLASSVRTTPRTDLDLWIAAKRVGRCPGGAMRIVRAAVAGDLTEAVVRVDQVYIDGEKVARKSVIGVWRTGLPEAATIWLNDATADPDEIELLAGKPVQNRTPQGRLVQRHEAVQVPIDVTKGTSAATALSVLRGVIAEFPTARRIGVITHKPLVPDILGTPKKGPKLEESFRRRTVRAEHFRGTRSRGSNVWVEECDLLIVLGTPRVPPPANRSRLIRTGRAAAVVREEAWEREQADRRAAGKSERKWWGRDYWSGAMAAGERRTIESLGYVDHDWAQAHRSLVQAELLQAAGRARTCCEHGIPVVAVTTENLGLPLLDAAVQPLTACAFAVLSAVVRLAEAIQEAEGASAQNPKGESVGVLSAQDPKRDVLGICAVSCAEVAEAVGLRERRVRYLLNELRRHGLVERLGERKGWRPSPRAMALLSASAPSCFQ